MQPLGVCISDARIQSCWPEVQGGDGKPPREMHSLELARGVTPVKAAALGSALRHVFLGSHCARNALAHCKKVIN